jgi:hypothetical protein
MSSYKAEYPSMHLIHFGGVMKLSWVSFNDDENTIESEFGQSMKILLLGLMELITLRRYSKVYEKRKRRFQLKASKDLCWTRYTLRFNNLFVGFLYFLLWSHDFIYSKYAGRFCRYTNYITEKDALILNQPNTLVRIYYPNWNKLLFLDAKCFLYLNGYLSFSKKDCIFMAYFTHLLISLENL